MWFMETEEQPLDLDAESGCELSSAETEKLAKIAGPALIDYFGIATTMARAQAEQYIRPLPFNDALHENETSELEQEARQARAEFSEERSEP